jgi:hypothetical protein
LLCLGAGVVTAHLAALDEHLRALGACDPVLSLHTADDDGDER